MQVEPQKRNSFFNSKKEYKKQLPPMKRALRFMVKEKKIDWYMSFYSNFKIKITGKVGSFGSPKILFIKGL